jgi:hypothetical protein
MDRYNDNVSPDPSSMHGNVSLGNCYKTPDISSQYSLYPSFNSHISMIYPTPPSDNDESSSQSVYSQSESRLKLITNQNEFTTPTLNMQHHHNSNQYNSHLLSSTNEIILDDDNLNSPQSNNQHHQQPQRQQQQSQSSNLPKTESTNAASSSSRYRRRSRTTYSKSQVNDCLFAQIYKEYK